MTPNNGRHFKGKIGPTRDESRPDWPVTSIAGGPNVLLVVLDDVGFGQLSCYGGPVRTPNIDRLAARGLRYNNFHTCAMCAPTRAALLTGRNPHSVGFGEVTEAADGYPGYNGLLPRTAGTVAHYLRDSGYNTAAFGKWHNTPDNELSVAGPYERWPLQKGFERFYGFLAPATSSWSPVLVRDNTPLEPRDEDGYHLTTDLIDQAIGYLNQQKSVAPSKPFFMWLALGAAHSPHHVDRTWSDRYKGEFDAGWDELRQRVFERQKATGIIPKSSTLPRSNPHVPAWTALEPYERRVYARMMEVYAGFLEHADSELGRLFDCLAEYGIDDETLIVVLSDNGASAEGGIGGAINDLVRDVDRPWFTEDQAPEIIENLGGPKYNNNYPIGWAQAGNSPFPWFKQHVFLGGVRDPLIISWPPMISEPGSIRAQFHHAVDVMPTVLEAAGVDVPESFDGVDQQPVEGVSMVYTFHEQEVESARTTQYFENRGNRAIYHEGWKAVTLPRRLPWSNVLPDWSFDDDTWQLFDLRDDYSQSKDLSGEHPAILRRMINLWWAEAGKHGVLPLGDRRMGENPVPLPAGDIAEFRFLRPVRIPERCAPDVKNRSHSFMVDLTLHPGDGGVICCAGDSHGGYTLYVKEDRLVYCHNYQGEHFTRVSSGPLGHGDHSMTINLSMKYDRSFEVSITVDERPSGRGQLDAVVDVLYSLDSPFEVGANSFRSVDPESYEPPFKFSGELSELRIRTHGDRVSDPFRAAQVASRRD